MYLHSMIFFKKNKILLNIGILLKGVLRPRLLSNPFAFLLINLDFLVPHIAYFHNIIIPPFSVFEISGLMFSVFFCTLDNKIALILYIILSSFFNGIALKEDNHQKWNLV